MDFFYYQLILKQRNMALDYPKDSLEKVLELSKIVDELGSRCSLEAYHEKAGRKFNPKGLNGAVVSLLASANKFGFAERDGDSIKTCDLYESYRLAIKEDEKKEILRTSILNIPLFKNIYNHYSQNSLPEKKVLEKELQRSFGVSRSHASRVASHIENAFLESDLMNSGRSINNTYSESKTDTPKNSAGQDKKKENQEGSDTNDIITNYKVTFIGFGMNATYPIEEEEDFAIIEAVLAKIKKKLTDR